MRTLTVMEMDAVAGGDAATGVKEDSLVQRVAQCTVDTMVGAATGAALGLATGGAGVVPLTILGAIAGNLASDACNSL